MSKQDKPREFWIQETAFEPTVFYSRKEFEFHENEMHELEERPFCDAVHVIEYSAFEAAQAKIAQLEKELKIAVDAWNVDFEYYEAKPHKCIDLLRDQKETLSQITYFKNEQEHCEYSGKKINNKGEMK